MSALMEAPAGARAHDPESREWLASLRPDRADRPAAVARLHDLLLRAARFEVSRRAATAPHLREHLDDIAQQSADDALMAVLGKLDTFRGDSRFTTWAYKFALYEAAVAFRRRAWRDREVTLQDAGWSRAFDAAAGPQRRAETAELLEAVRDAIDSDLSERQRQVLVAVALNDVPIDVLAERMDSNRNALYKTLHDARQKLRRSLAARGLDLTSIDEERPR